MGVDYYTCQNCSDTFPDCGYYFTCNGCESMFCSNECGKKQSVDGKNRWNEDLTSCIFCRHEAVTDRSVLLFLCRKYGITEEDANKECLEACKNGK